MKRGENGERVEAGLFVSAPREHIRRERAKAGWLKKTRWWQSKLREGKCYHCEGRFESGECGMDHLIPLARGGYSVKNNVVVSCQKCNAKKKHHIVFKS